MADSREENNPEFADDRRGETWCLAPSGSRERRHNLPATRAELLVAAGRGEKQLRGGEGLLTKLPFFLPRPHFPFIFGFLPVL